MQHARAIVNRPIVLIAWSSGTWVRSIGEAAGCDRIGDVARGDRAVKLAAVAGLAHQRRRSCRRASRPTFSASLLRSRLRASSCAFWRLEIFAVGLGGAQRLLLRQQEVAGKAVLHLHLVAHLAELLDAFEQDHLHGRSPTSRRKAAAP